MASRALACFATLVRPAAAVIGRLRYAQKFIVVGLVLLVPLGFVVNAYVGVQREQISASTGEQQGLRYLTPLLEFTGEVVEARHVAASTGGDASVDLDTGLARVDRADQRYGGALGLHDDWRAARRMVVAAHGMQDGSKLSRFKAYNAAIDALRALVARIGDRSHLILDPSLDSYYLTELLQFRLPALGDTAGRIGDFVELTSSVPTADFDLFIQVGIDYGTVETNRALISRAVKTILANTRDAAVRRTVEEQYRPFDAETAALGERLDKAVRNRSVVDFPSLSANHVRTAANLFAVTMAAQLDRLLRLRIEQLSQRAQDVEIWTGLAALLSIYLFLGFYRSVSNPIRRIVATLHAVADGDLSRRVAVDTHDELNYVATVLNETIAKTETATERLAIQATRDSLTGLPNRAVVLDRLDHALARTSRAGTLTAALFVDLDRFKLINDSLGHEAGDRVLRTVAQRLMATTREADTVARLAGDEFLIISEDLREADEALTVAERVVDAINETIMIENGAQRHDVSIGASVGIAFATGAANSSPSELLRDADMAMYRAKQRGRGRVEIFDDGLRAAIEQRAETQRDLRRAIENGELHPYYQPIVETATSRLLGFEALVRWSHPTRGLLAPGAFIDTAEESGLIVPLGTQILTEACRQATSWRSGESGESGERRVHVAVNVSAAQFNHPGFVPTVADVLDRTGMDPDALWLEITETSLLADTKAAAATLGAIRTLGVHLALDDFGTGYSSLTYLRQFPIEILKIDRSFVSGLGHNREDQAIVEMITNLAHSLDLLIIAEGVETTEQLDELRRLDCAACQGFYFGRPAPAELAWDNMAATALTPAAAR